MSETLLRRLAWAVGLTIAFATIGCGDDEPGTPTDAGTDATTDATTDTGTDAATDADAGGDGGLETFAGNCAENQWDERLSAECWSCICGVCAARLNACGPQCLDAIHCAIDAQCLTGADELVCEGRCVGAECADIPFLGEILLPPGPGFFLDLCLIGEGDADAGVLRGCEAECGLEAQPGVCERYPE